MLEIIGQWVFIAVYALVFIRVFEPPDYTRRVIGYTRTLLHTLYTLTHEVTHIQEHVDTHTTDTSYTPNSARVVWPEHVYDPVTHARYMAFVPGTPEYIATHPQAHTDTHDEIAHAQVEHTDTHVDRGVLSPHTQPTGTTHTTHSQPTQPTHEYTLLTPMYTWLFLVFGEALGKALPSLVEQAFDFRRRVRDAVARGETQHGHTWLF